MIVLSAMLSRYAMTGLKVDFVVRLEHLRGKFTIKKEQYNMEKSYFVTGTMYTACYTSDTLLKLNIKTVPS